MFLSEQQNELDWLAFQYVAGELDAAEAEHFELRLADDQAAREAVACAVEWTQVVAAAESRVGEVEVGEIVPAEKRAVAWGQRLSWMAVGGLLTLLVAVWSSGMFRGSVVDPGNSDSVVDGHSVAGGQLATAWYETRQQLRAANDVGPLHPLFAALDEEEDVSGPSPSDEELLLIDTPTWLTAAVAGVAGQGSDSTPDDEESGVN